MVNPWGGDGVSFKSTLFQKRVENLWALRQTSTIILMLNHGNLPPAGLTPGLTWMDDVDPAGTTGWEALWFAMGGFLLGFDDLTRNAAMGFTVWSYRGGVYFDEFNPLYLHLGRALAPFVVWPNGLMAREFEDGWIVVNPPDNPAVAQVAMPSGQARIYHHAVLRTIPPLASTFDLAPMRAIVLLKEGRLIGGDDNGSNLPAPAH
jgi:hypothetical protein